MNNKQREEVMDNATLIAQAVANVHALRFAVKQSAFEKCRDDLVKDLRLAEIALAALTTDPVGEVAMMDYSTAKDNDIVWVTLAVKSEKANSISLDDKMFTRAAQSAPVKLIGGSLKSDGGIWYRAETIVELMKAAGVEVQP